ncbi:hypothetical protein GCM10009804_05470 [Kribbella hippodromi]|uniref:Uncharacterized protein n=1 Tax=Kribbella hippodromi TaxID=434347 RepID=A0ABN2C5C0_9ACTN
MLRVSGWWGGAARSGAARRGARHAWGGGTACRLQQGACRVQRGSVPDAEEWRAGWLTGKEAFRAWRRAERCGWNGAA